jgi:hypothetical protein
VRAAMLDGVGHDDEPTAASPLEHPDVITKPMSDADSNNSRNSGNQKRSEETEAPGMHDKVRQALSDLRDNQLVHSMVNRALVIPSAADIERLAYRLRCLLPQRSGFDEGAQHNVRPARQPSKPDAQLLASKKRPDSVVTEPGEGRETQTGLARNSTDRAETKAQRNRPANSKPTTSKRRQPRP